MGQQVDNIEWSAVVKRRRRRRQVNSELTLMSVRVDFSLPHSPVLLSPSPSLALPTVTVINALFEARARTLADSSNEHQSGCNGGAAAKRAPIWLPLKWTLALMVRE